MLMTFTNHVLAADSVHWGGFKWTGSYTTIDLIAASTNALNGALLARRPDHYRNFTVVGIILMALLGGLGGGITRDVLVGEIPSALTNPAYILSRARLRRHRLPPRLHRRTAVPRRAVPVHDLLLAALVRDRRVPRKASPSAFPSSPASCSQSSARRQAATTSTSRAGCRRSSSSAASGSCRSPPSPALSGSCSPGRESARGGGRDLVRRRVHVRVIALYRAWEAPLAKEPKGVYKHADGRPMLGRKLAGKSQRELHDLGLTVDNGEVVEGAGTTAGAPG